MRVQAGILTPERKEKLGKPALFALEILIVLVWSLWIGREYLDFYDRQWPVGAEVLMTTESHWMWPALQRCGACFFWNGAMDGGVPAFVDVHGAPYHPIVALPTLLFGVINGIKSALLLSLFLAGVAQLWLGRIFKIHPVIAVWCALMAVAGGHLAGKMENGVVPLVISTACCSLVIPGLLQFLGQGSRKNTVLLALVIASAILAGQGYVQIGFVLSVLPVFLILALLYDRGMAFHWKRFGIAIGLALTFTAFFLLPLIRFLPSWLKNGDPLFQSAQPIAFLPLNLVINDWEFLRSPLLGKLPDHIYFYTNYIGWLPVILAVLSLLIFPAARRKIIFFCCACVTLVFCAASALTFKALGFIDPETLGMVQNPPLIAGLAIPFILILAGLSMQYLLDRTWPILAVGAAAPDSNPVTFSVKYPVLIFAALLMFAALRAAALFSGEFYKVYDSDVFREEDAVQAMNFGEVEWIQPPWAEYFWLPMVEERGMKIADFVRPWRWKDREGIHPRYITTTEDKPELQLFGTAGDFKIYIQPDVHYAAVQTTNSETVPCTATGMWGDLDVSCSTDTSGVLQLQEYYLDGWTVSVDGQPGYLDEGMFLSTNLAAGDHRIQFRYRPWDVVVGAIISAAGIILACIYWFKGRKENVPSLSI
jgi:hypothetical protein